MWKSLLLHGKKKKINGIYRGEITTKKDARHRALYMVLSSSSSYLSSFSIIS
jgi:hypothetical protein